jgi:hypothetical protein
MIKPTADRVGRVNPVPAEQQHMDQAWRKPLTYFRIYLSIIPRCHCTTSAPVFLAFLPYLSHVVRPSSLHEYLDIVSSVPYLCYLIRQMPAALCCPDNSAYTLDQNGAQMCAHVVAAVILSSTSCFI